MNTFSIYQVDKDAPTYDLQEELRTYHTGRNILVDIGDISIEPGDDPIDLFLSLIFAKNNIFVEGIVSKYVRIIVPADNNIVIYYKKAHQRSYINKEFKSMFIDFIEKDKPFTVVQHIINEFEHIDSVNFSQTIFYKGRKKSFRRLLQICKRLTDLANETNKPIEHVFYKNKSITS